MTRPFTLFALLLLATAAAFAAESPPNIVGQTVDETAEATGYTVDEIRVFFPPIERWGELGIEPAPEKIADTFARDRFRTPPEPYVHPRIYFGPDDLPRIREHLQQSHLARVQMELIRGRLLQISPNEEDWLNVPYSAAGLDAVYDDYLAGGVRITRRMGYHGPWVGGWINELAAGRDPEGLAGKWHLNTPQAPGRQYMMHLLPYEAFRCLIDEDEQGGRRIAAALVAICDRFAQHMDQYGPEESNWQRVYQNLSSSAIGLTYDWAYVWMTDQQRAKVRAFLADVTRGKTFIGLDHVPAIPANTTNWIIIHLTLLPMILAIEGEEGYDPLVYQRCVEGVRKWVYVAHGPCGAPFEGWTKSTYEPHWLTPLAKQGVDFIGTEYSKNVFRRFALHTMLPWGREHVFETGIGGVPEDVRPMKYAHPGDPVIDLLYGASVERMLDPGHTPQWPNIRTTYEPGGRWVDVFVRDDPIGLTDDGRYDFDRRFDEVMAILREAGEPLSYYSDFRGVMTARSGWHRDATFLLFEPRNLPGGHTWSARNDFVLASHGRLWSHRPEGVRGPSSRRSVILIDGEGQGHQCPQGRTVAFEDTADATFGAGDAAWVYRFRTGAEQPAAGHLSVPVTPNDSRVTSSPLPWMDQPWSFLPGWNNSRKGGARHSYWVPHMPVQYAFRSAGLVRGKHPYVLMVDDLRKDDQAHQYDWLMQVQDDVTLVRSGRTEAGSFDMILGEGEASGSRRLLLRVLATGNGNTVADDLVRGARVEDYEWEARGTHTNKRVVLPLRAVEGRYKILLYPFTDGDPLPSTTLDADGQRLTVAFAGQEDHVQFRPGDDGRTRIRLRRDGRILVELK